MTNLTLVTNNPKPHRSDRGPAKLALVGKRPARRYDDAWVKELADDARRHPGLVNDRFADCKTLRDVVEALDEIYNIGPTPWTNTASREEER